jgi:hypothetical protein
MVPGLRASRTTHLSRALALSKPQVGADTSRNATMIMQWRQHEHWRRKQHLQQQMDGWMIGGMDNWMGGWMIGWMDNGWMIWVDDWMDGWMDGWMDDWVD